MRLVSLQIENFRVLRDVKLNFTDQVIGLIGRNGAGKSSIIEAIAWALYGNQAARSGKGEIKSSFASENENCTVTLEFEIHDETYKVVRQLIGRNERAEVQLYRGEKSESVGVSETKGYIGELLGLDWAGFLTSFLARQQELNTLTDLQPARRKDHLAGMLGIERLDRAIKNVKEENRVSQAQAGMLQEQLQEKSSIELQVKQLTQQDELLSPKVKEVEEQSILAEKMLQEQTKELKAVQNQQASFERLRAELDAHQKTEKALWEREIELTSEIRQLVESTERIAVLSNQLEELGSIEESIDTLKQSAMTLELKKKLQGDLASIIHETSSCNDRLGDIQNRLSDIEKTLTEIPEEIEQIVATNRKLLEKDRDEYAIILAELKATKGQKEKLLTQIQQIDQLGAESVCDRCHRPLGKDIAEIRSHFGVELNSLDEQLLKLEERQALVSSQGKARKEELHELESKLTLRREGIQKREHLRKQGDEAKEQLKKLNERKKEVEADLSRMGNVVFNPEELNNLQLKLIELKKLQTEKEQLEGRLTRKAVAEGEKEKVGKQLAQERELISKLLLEKEQLQFSTEKYQSIVEKHALAQQEREKTRDSFISLKQKQELVKTELRGKKELQKKLADAEKQLEEIQVSQYYGVKLASLFSDFRGHLISRIRPTLADISSRLMTEMTDGRYTMVELDEKYDLRIMDNGEFYGVDRFSGGEKDLANLCLRLAISQALTQSAGLDRSFIILDEVFGSQDDGRKELILHALSRLKQFFPQILLITHIEDIRERVETLIEVRPTEFGWSGIKTDGT